MHQNLLKTDARSAAKCVSDFGLGYSQVNEIIHLVWHLPSASLVYQFLPELFLN